MAESARDRTGTRNRTVTEEPFRVDPDLLGRPLASVARRAIAIGVDGLLVAVVATVTIPLLALIAIWWQAPTIFEAGIAGMTGQAGLTEEELARYQLEAFRLVHDNKPGVLPPWLAEPVEADDAEALMAVLEERDIDLDFTLGQGLPSRFDPVENRLELHEDVIFGPVSNFVGVASIVILYFALLGMRGRTPGKWITGIRVVRLDGEPMTLGASFQRAGGYSASVSTLGTGFLQAIRDPNRQALHDRICGTVVIREPRRSRLRAAMRGLLERLRRGRDD